MTRRIEIRLVFLSALVRLCPLLSVLFLRHSSLEYNFRVEFLPFFWREMEVINQDKVI